MNRRLWIGALAFVTSSAWAECAREDVAFYLEKGFTTAQIAQLCNTETGERRQKSTYRSYTEEYVDQRDEEYEARMRIEREVSLRNSIEGSDIRLTNGWLEYIRKQCVSEGVEKDRIFGLKSCPNIRYRIRMANLEVDDQEHKKRFLFGQKMVQVTGDIRRQPLPDAFADIPDEYWREQLRRKLEKGDTTKIPLREGVDFHFVYGALKDMVAFETERQQARAQKYGAPEGELDIDSFGDTLQGAVDSNPAESEGFEE